MHKSGTKSPLCNIAMKISLWLSHIFVHTLPFCFAVTWCPSATSSCLSLFSNEPGIRSDTSGFMWHVSTESKTQFVNCELSPKFPLGHYSLLDMRAIDACIFWSLLFLLLFHERLPFSWKCTCFRRFLLFFSDFGNVVIRWSPYPHLKNFRGVCSFRLLYK